ncbi:MAG: tetratricopeptide repeat protein, partial [Bacteroidota bacterium]
MRKLANTAIKCLLLSLMWVPISGLKAQDFSAGFSMLEKGQFVEARSFFSEQLQKDSSNFTALICYGRATGLSGNILESQGIFRKLLIMKPGNVEVLLNLAESYLWDKNGKQAADLYVKIITDQPDNFAATLGYANSLSMTKQYEKAYQFIHKALQLEPNNAQAKVSRKFIRLGYADYLAAQQGEYEKALELVNDNLLD